MAASAQRDPIFTDWQLPTFSMEERERRWGRVRELMRRDGIDCIVGLNSTGTHNRNQADVRYLTQLGNNCEEVGVCFPLDGKVTAITNRGGYWAAGDWVGETMRSGRGWSRALIECLKAAGMENATVGVCGLTTGVYSLVRQPDGYAGYTAVTRMQDALPEARFVSATDVLGEARYVKSPEEVEFLRKGTAIAERACSAMLQTARVGVYEPLIMANMYQAAIAAGGSMPMMLGWTSGPFGDAYHRIEQPTHRMMQSGDYLTIEIEGRWGGYTAQIDQSVTFGDVPDWAEDAHKASVECFWDIVRVLKPGATFGELEEAAHERQSGRQGVGRANAPWPRPRRRRAADHEPVQSRRSSGPVAAGLRVRGQAERQLQRQERRRPRGRLGGDHGDRRRKAGTRPIDHYWHVE